MLIICWSYISQNLCIVVYYTGPYGSYYDTFVNHTQIHPYMLY